MRVREGGAQCGLQQSGISVRPGVRAGPAMWPPHVRARVPRWRLWGVPSERRPLMPLREGDARHVHIVNPHTLTYIMRGRKGLG
jgi:hypothetical protein